MTTPINNEELRQAIVAFGLRSFRTPGEELILTAAKRLLDEGEKSKVNLEIQHTLTRSLTTANQRLREAVELSIVRLKECRRFLPSHGTYAEDQINAHESAVTKLERALSQTPEATDEGKRVSECCQATYAVEADMKGNQCVGTYYVCDSCRRCCELTTAMASKTEGK